MNHVRDEMSIDHCLHLLLISSCDIREKPYRFLEILDRSDSLRATKVRRKTSNDTYALPKSTTTGTNLLTSSAQSISQYSIANLTLVSLSFWCLSSLGKKRRAPWLRTICVCSSVPVTILPTALNAEKERWDSFLDAPNDSSYRQWQFWFRYDSTSERHEVLSRRRQ